MRAWFLVLYLPVFVGCGGSKANCNSSTLYPAMIAVTNAATNGAICDADVTATGANGKFVLNASVADGGPCEYACPEVSGSYAVTVSKSGFQSATVTGVTAGIQTCDGPKPTTQVIPVKLTPS